MDGPTVDATVNEAIIKILSLVGGGPKKPTDIAKLVEILRAVHSDGYGHGLHQGHYDNTNPAG
jgi:hypothetical protein